MPLLITDRGLRNRVSIPETVLSQQSGTIILEGDDNVIVIGAGSTLQGGQIQLGSNCSFECGRECGLASIEVFAASHGHVRIGDGTGFTWNSRLLLHEAGTISLGQGCLIAGGTSFSVSDMHSIVDLATGRRINPAGSIQLGDRVWLGEGARVWKGVTIGAGSIVGTESLVTRDLPANCIAAGIPARVIREHVTWRPELIPADVPPDTRPEPRMPAESGPREPPVAEPRGSEVGVSLQDSVDFLASKLAREPRTFVSELHPDDDVLKFGRDTLRTDEIAVLTYYRYGAWIMSDYLQIADWRFGGLRNVPRLLEFACGFGRQTRYLVQEMPRDRIWCADVDPRATDFVRSRFGVNTFLSARSPGEIRCDGSFDLITVTSLFSHLPRQTFIAMLESLLRLLAPGGLLAFSVHDEIVHPSGKLPDDGFLFVPHSESRYLSAEDYGTTFVADRFVRGCIERIMGADWPYARLPRGLASHQDLYVVGTDPSLRFDGLRFRRGPEGCVERCELGPAGLVELSGWVGDPDEPDGAAETLVLLDSRVADRCSATHPREDVVGVLHEPKYRTAGWRCSLRNLWKPTSTLEVLAVARDGRSRPLLAGRLGSFLGRKLC
jgi:acetyltransferase-like isoleucine patch superfamily enzyme/SAM-dependent methyltransferase